MALTADEKSKLETKLTTLEDVYDNLISGASKQSVSFDGRSVSFTQGSIPALRLRIAGIKRQLGRTVRRSFRPQF